MLRHLLDRAGWVFAGASTVALILALAGVINAGPLDPTAPPTSPSGVFGSGTPISSLPYTISSSGSYYLTGNLTGSTNQSGITIAANDVTLDLRGFTLQGVPNSGSGVRLQSPTNWRAINIRNGTARGWGGDGFDAQTISGGVFDGLTAEGNGLWGILIGSGVSLTHCSASNNGAAGINALDSIVSSCVARQNASHGFQIIASVLSDCIASDNTIQGIDASQSRISGCYVHGNHGIGIKAGLSEILDNRVEYNNGTGIEVSLAGSLVERNNVHTNSLVGVGFGIDVPGSASRIDGNHVSDESPTPSQDVGFNVAGPGNVVINNSAHDNIKNYGLVGAGGTYGPQSTAAAATNPFANIDY